VVDVGISISLRAKNSRSPKVALKSLPTSTTPNMPVGPVGRPTEFQLFFNQ